MRISVTLLLLSLVACYAQSGDVMLKKEVKSQNGSDEIVYRLNPSPSQTEFEDFQAQIRDFIWERWNSRRIGKLKAESYTKEGEKMVSIFEIIVSEADDRELEVTTEREYIGRNPRAEFYKQRLKDIKRFSVFDIQRIKIRKNERAEPESIPKSADLPAKSYVIQLKDINGNVLSEI